jgi:hypothetical protein
MPPPWRLNRLRINSSRAWLSSTDMIRKAEDSVSDAPAPSNCW